MLTATAITAKVDSKDPTAPNAQAGPAQCATVSEPASQRELPPEAGKIPAKTRRKYTVAEKLEAVAIIENGGTFGDLASKFPLLKKQQFKDRVAKKAILHEVPEFGYNPQELCSRSPGLSLFKIQQWVPEKPALAS
ncbi:hypothetical protein HDU90_006004 [Geranomyces variabilis]|nr:hypothetical protein HDU90_006004 [Geranomyces variabilis]